MTILIDSTPLTVALIVLVSTFAMFLFLGWCWRRLGWTAGAMHLVCGDSLRTCFRASPRLVLVASLFATLGAWLVNVSVQLAVLLLGLAFGHAAPTSLQIAGGVTILMGSVGLTLWHQQPLVPTPIPVAATDIEKQKTPATETVPS